MTSNPMRDAIKTLEENIFSFLRRQSGEEYRIAVVIAWNLVNENINELLQTRETLERLFVEDERPAGNVVPFPKARARR